MKKLLLGLLLCSNVYAMDYSCSDDLYTVTVRDNNHISLRGFINGKDIDVTVENAGYRQFFSEEFYGSTVGDVEIDYIKLEVTALLKGTLSLRKDSATETRAVDCQKN